MTMLDERLLEKQIQGIPNKPPVKRFGLTGYNVKGVVRTLVPKDPSRIYVRFPDGGFVKALHNGKVDDQEDRGVNVYWDEKEGWKVDGINTFEASGYIYSGGTSILLPPHVHTASEITNLGDVAVLHSQIPYDGVVYKVDADTYEVIRVNLDATTAPTSSDDETEGYRIGSVWIDVSTGDIYDCVFADEGLAEWVERGSGSGGGGHEVKVNDTPFDQQPAINFLDGDGIAFTGTDDSGNSETEIKANLSIASLSNKPSPHVNDMLAIADSEDSNSIKNITIEDLAIAAAGGSTKTRYIGELIYEETLSANGDFDTGTLPTGYSKFEVELMLRGTVSSSSEVVYMQFNGDTTSSNYRSNISGGGNGSASNAVVDAPNVGTCPGSTTTAGYFSTLRIYIYSPEGSQAKTQLSIFADRRGNSTDQFNYTINHSWESTSAITSIQIRTDNHPADTFTAGSIMRVIGYKEEGIGGGITQFTELLDVPSDYAGHAGEYPRIKQDESGLEFSSGVAGGKLRLVSKVLHDETLGSNGAFDVSSISQDYDWLEVRMWLRGLTSAIFDVVQVYLNNDNTDANYRRSTIFTQDGTYSGTASDSPLIAAVPSGNSTSGDFGFVRVTIPEYTNSSHRKIIEGYGIGRLDATKLSLQMAAISWESASAVNRIQVRTDNHPTDLFSAGSRLQIIGYRNEMIGGLETSDASISATPTDAELDGIFGTPAVVGDGFSAIVDDGGAGTDVWLIVAKNGKWWGVQMQELT